MTAANDTDAVKSSAARQSILWPERIAALGLTLGLCSSFGLWTNVGRTFPVCGLIDCPLSPALDRLLFDLALFSAVSIVFNRFKPYSTIVLFASIFLLILLDLNRFQPWLYEYAVIIFLCSAPESNPHLSAADWTKNKLQSVSILLISLYLFSGLEKLNWRFFAYIGPWLLGFSQTTATSFENSVPMLVASGVLAAGEISFPIVLAFKRTRKLGLFMGLFMHATILYLLGPQRHNYNWAVWPWNLTQMCLLIACFANRSDQSLFRLKIKERPVAVATLIIVSLIVPILGLLQIADPYPAFALYSGDVPRGKLIVEKSVAEKLTPCVQRVCAYDQATGLWSIDISDWCALELGAAAYPSTFCLRRVGQRFAQAHRGELVFLRLLTYPKATRIFASRMERVGDK